MSSPADLCVPRRPARVVDVDEPRSRSRTEHVYSRTIQPPPVERRIYILRRPGAYAVIAIGHVIEGEEVGRVLVFHDAFELVEDAIRQARELARLGSPARVEVGSMPLRDGEILISAKCGHDGSPMISFARLRPGAGERRGPGVYRGRPTELEGRDVDALQDALERAKNG